MNPTIKTKKAFLYTLIVSVVISAILGVVGILKGTGGWYEVRIFFTTITISAMSICGLACGAYLEQNRNKILPLVGILLSLITGVLTILGIWFEPNWEDFGKVLVSAATVTVAIAHICLLLLARLARRFRWSRLASAIAVGSVAFIAVAMIWGSTSNDQWVWKTLGVASIGAASMTVLTPVFHWLSRHDVEARSESGSRVEAIEEEIVRLTTRIHELEQERASLS